MTPNLSKSLFQSTHPEKQSIQRPRVICEDDEMAKAEDDPLGKLLLKLHKLKRGPVELERELRVFGLHFHVPLYINLNYALEIITGDKMLNISIIQL